MVPFKYQLQYIALDGFCLVDEIRFKLIVYICGHARLNPIEHEIKIDLSDDLDHNLQTN